MNIATANLRASAAHLWGFSALLSADPETRSLNMRHLQLLALICRSEQAISIGALASLTDRQSYTVSRSVARLAERGLIARVQSTGDLRMTDVTATPAGRALDSRVVAFFDAARVSL